MVGTSLVQAFWVPSRRAASAARVWGVVLALGVALSAGAANAVPVFFTGAGNIGTTQAEALAAIASFSPSLQLLDLDLPLPGLGSVIFSGAGAATVAAPDCSAVLPVDPSPACIALRLTISPQTLPGSQASPKPVIATKAWTVTNSTGQDLAAAYLLFTTSAGANSANPALVGLDPDPADGYVMVEMSGLYAAAIALGPLAAGASTTALVNYFVNDDLQPTGTGNFLLPQLNPEAILVPVTVPEPGTLVLLTVGLISTIRMRRSRCE